jgi:hypothetical protein
MANHYNKQFQQSYEQGIVSLYGEILVGASGVITSSACKGFTIVKTATEVGRYTVTLNGKYSALKMCSVVTVGPADAALTSASGIISSVRNNAVSTAATFDIQMSSNVDLADAEATSGVILKIAIVLKNSSAF